MTYLLWVRTSRGTGTLTPEIDELRRSLIQYSNVTHDWVEPFVGGDQVLFGIDSIANIHSVKGFISPSLKRDYVVDWSLTDVGTGVGPEDQYWDEDEEGALHYDERFLAQSEDDYVAYYDDVDETEIAKTKAAERAGFTRLRWRLDYDAKGATVLWVDLNRERTERDRTMRQIEQLLPKPYKHMWHGRSSLAFGYSSQHDPERPAPFGISAELKLVLDGEDVAYFLAFQVGSWSVGGVAENMNQMADFIWSRRPKAQATRRPVRGPSQRPADRDETRYVSVVRKPNRALVRKPNLSGK